jgi:hypothetical protein
MLNCRSAPDSNNKQQAGTCIVASWQPLETHDETHVPCDLLRLYLMEFYFYTRLFLSPNNMSSQSASYRPTIRRLHNALHAPPVRRKHVHVRKGLGCVYHRLERVMAVARLTASKVDEGRCNERANWTS